jgi:hypothetical protein
MSFETVRMKDVFDSHREAEQRRASLSIWIALLQRLIIRLKPSEALLFRQESLDKRFALFESDFQLLEVCARLLLKQV